METALSFQVLVQVQLYVRQYEWLVADTKQHPWTIKPKGWLPNNCKLLNLVQLIKEVVLTNSMLQDPAYSFQQTALLGYRWLDDDNKPFHFLPKRFMLCSSESLSRFHQLKKYPALTVKLKVLKINMELHTKEFNESKLVYRHHTWSKLMVWTIQRHQHLQDDNTSPS